MLGRNRISDKGIMIIAENLYLVKNLQEMHLSTLLFIYYININIYYIYIYLYIVENEINDDGAFYLLTKLGENNKFRKLTICDRN